jgi:hypothetical protein
MHAACSYDLPAEYNAQFLQYRLTPGHCSWRAFSGENHTHFNAGVYLLETYFHETLIASSHRHVCSTIFLP